MAPDASSEAVSARRRASFAALDKELGGLGFDERELDAAARKAHGVTHARDFLIAYAAGLSKPRALALCEEHLQRARRGVLALTQDEDVTDEVLQALRARLFSTNEGEPRIRRYHGHGSLDGWIRTAALRLTVDFLRKGSSEESNTAKLELGLSEDVELSLLKRQYREAFREAFQGAVSALSDRERALLRFQLEGLHFEEIGRVMKLSKSSVYRHLEAARKTLLESTHARLRAALPLTPSEVDDVFMLVQSQLDVSLRRVLGAQAA
jgi:RNA polymerase sigma-70 factor (ECF subfamily)